ncbi:mediator of RNA polymerase II transcription subunit 18 isoform X3 [Zeugodacus cucurbitae]|uniref:mediator of RNA polymerase II transcription subunit 18 isoform X3 n=1 Tax=Zeugodacus cucurbitae TaxID=28588 RepID=UPI0023D954CD|nr:mediator of RNA polymerase II transcription subunit 18 isoform X3 [Zeugodacus cucurbitae]
MAQITNSKELLSTALQSRIIPNQEFLLQGSILDSAVDHLIHRCRPDKVFVPLEMFSQPEFSIVVIMNYKKLYFSERKDENNCV